VIERKTEYNDVNGMKEESGGKKVDHAVMKSWSFNICFIELN